jgi:hypothetical protein
VSRAEPGSLDRSTALTAAATAQQRREWRGPALLIGKGTSGRNGWDCSTRHLPDSTVTCNRHATLTQPTSERRSTEKRSAMIGSMNLEMRSCRRVPVMGREQAFAGRAGARRPALRRHPSGHHGQPRLNTRSPTSGSSFSVAYTVHSEAKRRSERSCLLPAPGRPTGSDGRTHGPDVSVHYTQLTGKRGL